MNCQILLLYNPSAATCSLRTNYTVETVLLINIIVILNEFIWISTKTYEKNKGLILTEATHPPGGKKKKKKGKLAGLEC